MSFVTRDHLLDFLTRLDAEFARPGRVLLVGETSLLFAERRPWVEEIEMTAETPPKTRLAFDAAVRKTAEALGIDVWMESPGEVIPLPDGSEDRHRMVRLEALSALEVGHFDPYSVAYRFIARGDEPDYHLVLSMIDLGWLSFDELEARLAGLLPRFSMETIAQDPAEFERKFKGLRQMAAAIAPGTLHRHTPA